MRAWSLIRSEPWYRKQAFDAGLHAAGYDMPGGAPVNVRPGDALLAWNRYGAVEQMCDRFESEGGTVFIAENGFLNKGGGNPKFDAHEGLPGYYALALDQHNGAGRWHVGGAERWAALEIQLKPWREGAAHNEILICPNRPFGSRKIIPPANWAEDRKKALRPYFAHVRIREHPGNHRPRLALADDLKTCWVMEIWASSAGIHALVEGVPVNCHSPYWICKGAGNPIEDRRRQVFERLAWAQWSVEEIARGEPFRHLLCAAGQEQVAAGA